MLDNDQCCSLRARTCIRQKKVVTSPPQGSKIRAPRELDYSVIHHRVPTIHDKDKRSPDDGQRSTYYRSLSLSLFLGSRSANMDKLSCIHSVSHVRTGTDPLSGAHLGTSLR
ncbi:hypothetical protein J6590_012507 [Homalodisca vitripennis]|nr:hypothetical protein J6590_012507 [Homalodisca vitripennis]